MSHKSSVGTAVLVFKIQDTIDSVLEAAIKARTLARANTLQSRALH